MSALSEYVEKVKQETEGFSEVEKLRYIYLSLGKRFNFDLNFSFGSSKEKREIYYRSDSEEHLNENMEKNTITCRSISSIFEYVSRSLGLHVRTISDSCDRRSCPHVYNIFTDKNGESYTFDLQEDMRNIKANLRTKYFGRPIFQNGKTIVSRQELEEIDKKLGYVTRELYYTDEFLDMIKLDMAMFDNFEEKVEFVLENLDSYNQQPMGYADRRWRMEDIIGEDFKEGRLFSSEERRKLHLIDCYREENGKRKYELCIVVNGKGRRIFYLFSEEENRFCKKTMEEIAELTENGLKSLEGIPGLKQYLKEKNRSK